MIVRPPYESRPRSGSDPGENIGEIRKPVPGEALAGPEKPAYAQSPY